MSGRARLQFRELALLLVSYRPLAKIRADAIFPALFFPVRSPWAQHAVAATHIYGTLLTRD